MHTDRAAAFHVWMIKARRRTGITPTSVISDSDDMDLRNPDFQVYGFVCQAKAALKPKQLVALFEECQRIDAVVLEIVYQETEHKDDDAEGDDDWRELVCSVPRLPGTHATFRQLPSYIRVVK